MKEYETAAAKRAKEIVDGLDSHFVTDDVIRAWIRTAITEAYSAGRLAVFHEEQESLIAQARETFARGDESRSMNRKQRRAAEKGKRE